MPGSRRTIIVLQAGILLIGAVLTAAGIFLGEHIDIMRKAVIICLECIGIG